MMGSRVVAVVFSADLTGCTRTSGCGSLYKSPDACKHEKQEQGHTVTKRVFFLGC